jgi:hypothetical protein
MKYEMRSSNIYEKAIKGTPIEKRTAEIAKLEQYNDPTAHFRMVREEVAQAAKDGKTKLQFPTGDTAMKIEGLGTEEAQGLWQTANYDHIKLNELKPGQKLLQGFDEKEWVVTDVLKDGKFKAVPKRNIGEIDINRIKKGELESAEIEKWKNISEEFDISGGADKSNPIYRFYEKTLGQYLKSKFNAKEITDSQGVKWFEVDINPEQGKQPIEAFGIAAFPALSGALRGKKEEKK